MPLGFNPIGYAVCLSAAIVLQRQDFFSSSSLRENVGDQFRSPLNHDDNRQQY